MHTIRFLFICLFVLFPTQVLGQGFADSPWPMIGHDPGHTFRGIDAPPATDVLKWKFKCEIGMGSPSIGSDGTIYVGSQDYNIYAINPDGTMKWKYTADGTMHNSTPAIGDDGTIYIGSQDSCLYAINPDGTLKWRYRTGYDIISSPNIGYNGNIYISSGDRYFYAFNPDGELEWKYFFAAITGEYPAIGGDGTVYFTSTSGDQNLYALNPDGTFKWKYGTYCNTSPSVSDNDSTIYVGYYSRYLVALNLDGTLKWDLFLGDGYISASPAIGEDGTIYIGSRDYSLYAINPDGTMKWIYLTDRHLYRAAAIGSDGCVYVQNYYHMYAINSDGTLRWKFPTVGGYTNPAIGADGTLYFGAGDYLYALTPEEVASVESKPVAFTIEAPYPNPFNPSTVLSYSLSASSHVKIAVYSINGQKVAELTNAYTSAGRHSVVFDGSKYASGVYFYRFTTSAGVKTGKMLLVK